MDPALMGARRLPVRLALVPITVILALSALTACSSSSPRQQALQACNDLTHSGAGDPYVSASTRRHLLQEVEQLASRAAKSDPRWTTLAQAITAIRQGEAAAGYGPQPYYQFASTAYLSDCSAAGQAP